MGAAAVAIADVDADGHPDLHVSNSKEGSRNRLYRNRGDGTFEESPSGSASPMSISAKPACRWAPCSATTTTTGSRIFYKWGRPELFHNEQGTVHTGHQRIAAAWANINPPCGSTTIATAARSLPRRLLSRTREPWQLADTKMMPESFEYAKNGGRSTSIAISEGAFEEVSAGRPDVHALGLAAVAADLRGTGYPDCSSPTITAYPSSSSTRADVSARPAAKPASATRRRAA